MNRTGTLRVATRIDEIARAVILEALGEADRTQAELARFCGVSRAAMSRRLRGNKQSEIITYYQWTLGELVALSNWLQTDILGRIAEESRAGRRAA